MYDFTAPSCPPVLALIYIPKYAINPNWARAYIDINSEIAIMNIIFIFLFLNRLAM